MPKFDREKFIARREEIKLKPEKFGYKAKNEFGMTAGTQKWLEHESGVKERTIQSLESTDTASNDTIRKISKVLQIDGFQYAHDINAGDVRIVIERCIDFRPAKRPEKGDAYLDSNLMMTIDHFGIDFLQKSLEYTTLKKVEASIDLFKSSFIWWYFVSINEDTKTWLGREEDASEIFFEKKGYTKKSIMLKQNDKRQTSWEDFIINIENSSEKNADIEVIVHFQYFKKKILLQIDLEDIRIKFNRAREKRNSKFPYRVQTIPVVLS